MTFRHEQRISPNTWIVVADRGRARILSATEDAPATLSEVASLDCPDALSAQHDQVSDRQGYFKGRDGTLEAGEAHTDFKHQTAEQFARELVQYLDQGRQQQKFGHLIVAAAPLFLGVLKAQFGGPLQKLVEMTIDKDYTSLPVAEIATRLQTAGAVQDGS